MRTFCTALLVAATVTFAGTVRAEDDNAKKIVGIWELTKSGGDLPVGSTLEFTKDGKLTAVVKSPDVEKLEGTFKIEKDQLTVKVKIGDSTLEETATIKKLTDDELEIEDKDKKVDIFKKKKANQPPR